MALPEKEKQKLLADLEGKISNSAVFKKYREQRENLNKVRTFNPKEHCGKFPISLTALSPNLTGASRSITGIKVNVSLLSHLTRGVFIAGNAVQYTKAANVNTCELKENTDEFKKVFKILRDCFTSPIKSLKSLIINANEDIIIENVANENIN